VLLLSLEGFVAGAAIGAWTVADGSGLAGGATVFVYGVGGAVLAAIAGFVLTRRLTGARFRIAFALVVMLALLIAGWVAFRIASIQAPRG
jgi:hypothetical protein